MSRLLRLSYSSFRTQQQQQWVRRNSITNRSRTTSSASSSSSSSKSIITTGIKYLDDKNNNNTNNTNNKTINNNHNQYSFSARQQQQQQQHFTSFRKQQQQHQQGFMYFGKDFELAQKQQQQQQQDLSSSFLWNIRRPEKGTGFDNFLPKNDKKEGEEEGKEDETKFKTDGDGGGGDDDDNNKKGRKKKKKNDYKNNTNEDNSYTGLVLFGAFLALVYYLEKNASKENLKYMNQPDGRTGQPSPGGGSESGMDREISWSDFLQLLRQRAIVKVVVPNTNGNGNGGDSRFSDRGNMVRVFVKNNIQSLNTDGSSGLTFSSSDVPSSNNNNNNIGGANTDSMNSESTSSLSTANSVGSSMENFEFHPSSSTNNNSPLSSLRQPAPYQYYRMHIGSVERFERKLEEAQRAIFGNNLSYDVPVQYTADNAIVREVLSIIPSLLMAAVLYGMMRFAGGVIPGAGGSGGSNRGGMGGIFQIGKSTHKKINKEDVSVTFADVAGCEEAKKEIMEFVDFLKDSERFTKLGAKIPKGALLCGPPGTGKTLLAKAVAGEAGVPFYSISGSDFIEMFVGVGPSRVRDLFSEARQNAPCIIFIDEIDAVGRQRGRAGVGGNDERENTLNQLLVEMDGFSPTTGVVVLAGTNRVDILDNALTRAGRFDRQIVVDKPDLKGRQAIFKVHLRNIALEDDVDDIAGRLAGLTPGFAGADIANICNEAAIVAARRKADKVSLPDFEKATDRIIGGLESNKIMSREERSIVAHHEAGHAVAGWFLQHADPLLKVTIIPRSSGALGFAQYLPKEVFLRTQEQIMDIVCMALAGRAAEEIFFGKVTTGASDDLRRVTQLVYSTIQLYGMNSRLGQLAFPKDPNAMFDERPYSEKTAKAMDEEAKLIVDEAYQRTINLLREKKHEVETIANLLIEKETITHDDIIAAIGNRPFKADPMYEEFIRRRAEDKKKDEEKEKKQPSEDDDASSGSEDLTVNPGLLFKG